MGMGRKGGECDLHMKEEEMHSDGDMTNGDSDSDMTNGDTDGYNDLSEKGDSDRQVVFYPKSTSLPM